MNQHNINQIQAHPIPKLNRSQLKEILGFLDMHLLIYVVGSLSKTVQKMIWTDFHDRRFKLEINDGNLENYEPEDITVRLTYLK